MPVEPRAWPELQTLLPPLSVAERGALSSSIAVNGVLMPILIMPDGRIIDGHHRWELSSGTAPYQVIEMPEGEAFTLGLVMNVARRQLSPEQIVEVHDHLRKHRELRKRVALAARGNGKTQAEVAALVGVDRASVSRWETGSDVQMHNPSLADVRVSVPRREYNAIHQRHEVGETQAQIAADYKVTRRRIGQIVELVKARDDIPPQIAEEVPLPDRKYRCIVIDPPWPIKKIEREVRQKQGRVLDYSVMSLDEIGSLPIGELAVAAGCHVYLWITQRFLPDGLRILEGWGVKYQCVMTWVKPTGFTPFSWMYNTEHVLFGRIGNLPLERLGLKLSFEASSNRHSKKPDVFYERVIQASPGPRLDMFARQARSGFDVWGNEVASA